MCTPAIRELKRLNPNCYIRFFTDFGSLVSGLPYIDEVHAIQDSPADAHQLSYEACTPPRGHLAKIIGDQLGVNVTNIQPDCIVNQGLVESYRSLLQAFPKPHVVILRRASRWTPNKDWPDQYWNIAAEEVSRLGTVIEIGSAPGETLNEYGSYLDLREKTTVEQMAAIIATADLYIGPVSGPLHIAAAVGTPAVVIYGGYEHPIGQQGYDRLAGGGRCTQINLYTPRACAPCWRADECPYNRKCLSMIEPAQVLEAARKLLTL
jgi:ADP-heptose:LPS heptosyltransferase